MMSLLLRNNFYLLFSDIPTSSKGKESDELLDTAGSLVMVREPVARRG